jgi:hypothetical protein
MANMFIEGLQKQTARLEALTSPLPDAASSSGGFAH